MRENPKWLDNSIQFPRLIAEINAIVDISKEDWVMLQESMDLNEGEIIEIFDRANDAWESIKNGTLPSEKV